MPLTESEFEWSDVSELPKDRLLKIVAKTLAPTIHPESKEYPIRMFAESELLKSARMLIHKPIGINHTVDGKGNKICIEGAFVADAEFDEKAKQAEAVLYIPPTSDIIDKVKKGIIKKCSIEYTWRELKRIGEAVEFIGLKLTAVDLLEGLPPGDPNTSVALFESGVQICTLEADVTLSESTPPVKEEPKVDNEKRIKELEDAVVRLTNKTTEYDKKIDEAIKKTRIDTKAEVIKRIEDNLPQNPSMSRSPVAVKVYIDMKKAVKEVKESS
jgi:hypothetical protein